MQLLAKAGVVDQGNQKLEASATVNQEMGVPGSSASREVPLRGKSETRNPKSEKKVVKSIVNRQSSIVNRKS